MRCFNPAQNTHPPECVTDAVFAPDYALPLNRIQPFLDRFTIVKSRVGPSPTAYRFRYTGSKPSEFIQILVIIQNPFKCHLTLADIIFRFQADNPVMKRRAFWADGPFFILKTFETIRCFESFSCVCAMQSCVAIRLSFSGEKAPSGIYDFIRINDRTATASEL